MNLHSVWFIVLDVVMCCVQVLCMLGLIFVSIVIGLMTKKGGLSLSFLFAY